MSMTCMAEGGQSRSWRDSGIRSRLSYALEQEGFQKDVTFVVGEPPEIISAHRLILSLSSTYFDKLIRNGGGGLITLPKACPKMFKRLLKFIYSDEIDCEQFLPFLDFAESFGFNYLGEICLESLERTGISVENVIFILTLEGRRRKGKNLEVHDKCSGLRDKCLQFIKRNVERVVRLDSFNEIPQEDLRFLLESEDFIMQDGEFSVFLVALRWAKHQCNRFGGGESTEKFKVILGDARLKIRFTQIPYPKLLAEVKSSGLLSKSEFLQVLKTFIDPEDNPLGLSTQPRSNIAAGVGTNMSNSKIFEPKLKRKRTEIETTETPTVPLPSSLPSSEIDLHEMMTGIQDEVQPCAIISEPSSSNHDALTRAPYLKIVTSRSDQLVLQRSIATDTDTATATTISTITKEPKETIPIAVPDHQRDCTSDNFEPLLPLPQPETQVNEFQSQLPLPEPTEPQPVPSPVANCSTAPFIPPIPSPPPAIPTATDVPSGPPVALEMMEVTPSTSSSFPPDLSSSSPSDFLLSNSTINWAQLISEAKAKRSTLARIVLNNTTLRGFNSDTKNRILLPHLHTFHYSFDRDPNISHNFKTSNPTLPDKTHPFFVSSKAFLFFEKSTKPRARPWLFSHLPNLGVDIKISVKGIHLMRISPTEKKIILSYPPAKQGDAILDNCPRDTKSLSLCCAGIKSPDKIPTQSLEHLTLYNVEIKGMTATRFVNQCTALTHLSLYEFSDTNKLGQLHLTTDLQKCRRTLRSLSLSKFNVNGLSPKCAARFVPFSALDDLYLNCCKSTHLFVTYLGTTFPNLKRFGIRWEWKDKAATSSLLKAVLEQLSSLELISISHHESENRNQNATAEDAEDDEEGERDEYNLYPTEEEAWIQNFLVETAPVAPDTAPAPFGYVEEDLLAQNIILRKVNGVWTRSGSGNVNEDDEEEEEEEKSVDDAEVDQIHFQALKLDHFFADVGMIKYL